MKIVAIGDLHGKDCWKNLDFNSYDKVIFLGDYVDTISIPESNVVNNLEAILSCADTYPDKVMLLLGNHDIQYLEYPKYRCNGFNSNTQPILTRLFSDNRDKFKIAFLTQNTLFTHAGLSNGYFHEIFNMSSSEFQQTGNDLAQELNAINNDPVQQLKLHQVGYRRGGLHKFGGVTWADLSETMADCLEGFHQVIGHTKKESIVKHSINEKTSITCIDVLESKIEFFEIEII
jgi:predicted phosphodiesterase